ncbi:MAG: cache domain-containing protein [Chloroflexota bacterium]
MDRKKKSRIVLLGIILGIWLFGFALDSLFFQENRELQDASVNAQRITSSIAEKIGEMILSYELIAEEAANTLNHCDSSLINMHELLDDVVGYNENVYGCMIAFMGDTLKSGKLLNVKYCNKEWGPNRIYDTVTTESIPEYYEIKSLVNKQPLLLDETMAQLDKNVGACYFIQFRAKDTDTHSGYEGIIGLELKKDWFISFIESVSDINRDRLFLVNYKGRFLYKPRKSIFDGSNINEVARRSKSKAVEDLARRMLKGESGIVRYNPHSSKERYFLYFRPVPHVKCYVGILFPEKELIN